MICWMLHLSGREGAELGLGGVEAVEGGGDLALELVEDGVHDGRITLHGLRTCG